MTYIDPELYGAVKALAAEYGTQELMAAVEAHLDDLAELDAES